MSNLKNVSNLIMHNVIFSIQSSHCAPFCIIEKIILFYHPAPILLFSDIYISKVLISFVVFSFYFHSHLPFSSLAKFSRLCTQSLSYFLRLLLLCSCSSLLSYICFLSSCLLPQKTLLLSPLLPDYSV